MVAFVALLRAVNVGGTGKLPMTDLKAICEELGFGAVRTYIASGNVVFTSRKSEAAVKSALEKRPRSLCRQAGRRAGSQRGRNGAGRIGQSVSEGRAQPHLGCLSRPRAAGRHAYPRSRPKGRANQAGRREIYVHYGEGMAKSKLVIPAAKLGTARNINTVVTLAKMAAES